MSRFHCHDAFDKLRAGAEREDQTAENNESLIPSYAETPATDHQQRDDDRKILWVD